MINVLYLGNLHQIELDAYGFRENVSTKAYVIVCHAKHLSRTWVIPTKAGNPQRDSRCPVPAEAEAAAEYHPFSAYDTALLQRACGRGVVGWQSDALGTARPTGYDALSTRRYVLHERIVGK